MSATTDRTVPKGALVGITGGSGFIASFIIEQLLEKGYRVRAIVRSLKNKDKLKHLEEFPQTKGQLEIVEADIESGKYGEVLQGCDALIHTATPYIYTAPDPQKDIVDPAIKGTVDAFEAALKAKLKRIIITSSGGAIFHFPVENNYVFTEKDWNTSSSLTNGPYFYSKKLAEEAAWKLYEKHKDDIDMVVVNPLLVVGPSKSAILNTSLDGIRKQVTGEQKVVPPGFIGIVHVKDVATCHMIALENPKAVGKRFMSCGVTTTWKRLADRLKALYPEYPITTDPEEKGIPVSYSNALSKELGMGEYVGLDEMLKDCVESLIAHKAIPDLRTK